jgi:hypothetical protein
MSYPYTSQQNGRVERILRTVNNIVRSLLFQARLPPPYWVEALHTATYLLNLHPTSTLHYSTPHLALYGRPPSYNHLCIFGCKCYPNISATVAHKLAPRSTTCVFLGYSSEHKGYRCLHLSTNHIIISRHVVFDESSFPFTENPSISTLPTNLDFLDDFSKQVHAPPLSASNWPLQQVAHSSAGTSVPLGGRSPSPSGAPAPGPSSFPGPRAPRPPTPPRLSSPPRMHAPGPMPPSPPGPPAPSPLPPEGADSSLPWRWGTTTKQRSTRQARPPPATSSSAPVGFVPALPVVNSHGMRTRAKSGFHQPRHNLHIEVTAMSPVPSTYRRALDDPLWR